MSYTTTARSPPTGPFKRNQNNINTILEELQNEVYKLPGNAVGVNAC